MDLLANVIEFAPVMVNPSRPSSHQGIQVETMSAASAASNSSAAIVLRCFFLI